jgi:hypothetical protein
MAGEAVLRQQGQELVDLMDFKVGWLRGRNWRKSSRQSDARGAGLFPRRAKTTKQKKTTEKT